MVTDVPVGPDEGDRLVIVGAEALTVNERLLLATPPTVTTTGPVVAPPGTGTTTLVALQLVGVAVVPLNLTVLVPFDAPKPEPAIVTEVPIAPDGGDKLVRTGAAGGATVRSTEASLEGRLTCPSVS